MAARWWNGCARIAVHGVVLWDGTRVAHPSERRAAGSGAGNLDGADLHRGLLSPADGDVIVDAGANIGLFAIYVARQNSTCRVVALEPFAENFRYLQANAAPSRRRM